MSSFSEETLDNRRDLPPDIRTAKSQLESAVDSTSNADDTVGSNGLECRQLMKWCKEPLVKSSVDDKLMAPFEKYGARVAIYPLVDEIAAIQNKYDVVLLIGPTGSGKSILAPYISELLGRLSKYRKTMFVCPSVEHCASTSRTFGDYFRSSGIITSSFYNPYEEQGRGRDGSAEFVYCTYSTATRVLPEAALNLLILDEIHESNANVQETISMALKKMLAEPFIEKEGEITAASLHKLMLMTATLGAKEREKYEELFTSQGLSFVIIDITDILCRKMKLTMSCLQGPTLPEMFESVPLSVKISEDLANWGCSALPSDFTEAKELQFERLILRFQCVLITVMGDAWENLREKISRGGRHDMQTILVILDGYEMVDTLYSIASELEHFHFDNNKKQPGFHLIRMTSLVKDERNLTAKCTLPGFWGGNLGRIVLTTNHVASGLTIPNTAYVISCGRQKVPFAYARNGLRGLETTWIDRQSIIQQAGRTGRDTPGQFILPFPVEIVERMMQSDHGELYANRNFEESHLLHSKLYNLKLMYELPEKMQAEMLLSMEIRGIYSKSDGFSKDVILMNEILYFLSPEFARIVIQGTRLGIAAHAILYVADCISRIKFCLRSNGNTNSTINQYCEAMDQKRNQSNDKSNLPESYKGVGDSIALADLLASFYSLCPKNKDYHRKEITSGEMKIPECNFWSSKSGIAELYTKCVRDEGRDSVKRYATQIQMTLQDEGILSTETTQITDPSLNRHIVSTDNYCLDQKGRALFSALLSMHSSRVSNRNYDYRQPIYEIYREGNARDKLSPESVYTQAPQVTYHSHKYGRFFETFKRRDHTGYIDPITLKQIVFFLNVNGKPIFRLNHADPSDCSATFQLNAAIGKSGMKIRMDETTCGDAKSIRSMLQKCLKMLTYTTDERLISQIEEFIVALWRECEKTEEDVKPCCLTKAKLGRCDCTERNDDQGERSASGQQTKPCCLTKAKIGRCDCSDRNGDQGERSVSGLQTGSERGSGLSSDGRSSRGGVDSGFNDSGGASRGDESSGSGRPSVDDVD